jgi:hypothetical protein
MLLPLRRLCSLLLCSMLLFVLSGCGQRLIAVKGTFIPSKKMSLVEGDVVQVTFLPVDTKTGSKSAFGQVNVGDKSFVPQTGLSKGMVPGKYKVAVEASASPEASKDKQKRHEEAREITRIFGILAPKMTCEIPAEGPVAVTVDLDKREVKVSKE